MSLSATGCTSTGQCGDGGEGRGRVGGVSLDEQRRRSPRSSFLEKSTRYVHARTARGPGRARGVRLLRRAAFLRCRNSAEFFIAAMKLRENCALVVER